MTGFPLIIAFVLAIVVMIVAISKYKIHPFLSIMSVSLILALIAGIPLGRSEEHTNKSRTKGESAIAG